MRNGTLQKLNALAAFYLPKTDVKSRPLSIEALRKSDMPQQVLRILPMEV